MTNAATTSCKVCLTPSALLGTVDFNKNCEEPRGKRLPDAGVPVAYHRCLSCGFVFTTAFDGWSQAEFQRHIYNDGYLEVDPDYPDARPAANVELLAGLFAAGKARLRVLDYGGGNGRLADGLRVRGFAHAATFDPFTPRFATMPAGPFDIVTCFETIEHMPDPVGGIAAIASCLKGEGLIVFSTLVQPPDFDAHGVRWWYVAPRNGHVSIHSRQSLALCWKRAGFALASFNDNLHVACRRLPDFARHLGAGPS